MKSNGVRVRTPVGMIEDAIWRDDALSPYDRLVLLALKHHTADPDIGCYPSQERLAQRTGMSVRMVRKATKSVERGGWVRVERLRIRGARYLVNVYFLLIPEYHRPAAHGAAGAVDDRHPVPAPPAHGAPKPPAPGAAESSHRNSPTERAREGACEAGASPSRLKAGSVAAVPSFDLTPTDGPQWSAWMDTLSADDRVKAEAAGRIEVTSRWPATGGRVLRIHAVAVAKAKPSKQTEVAHAPTN